MAARLLAAVLLGLAITVGMITPARAQASQEVASSWHRAGCYRSYAEAMRKAAWLQKLGYDTYIKYVQGYYCVYYA